MSGFAILIDPHSSAQEREIVFKDFLQLVADYKNLNVSSEYIVGRCCTGAKLDSPSALHLGVTKDELTGSWLIASGTLVNLAVDYGSDLDLNVLLRDYVENGAVALQHYDGHFALAIYNGREDSLSIISDPMGLFSIFFGRRGEQIFVATSALAIARQIHSQPDRLGVQCFLSTGRVYENKTLWHDVKRVPAATVLNISHGRVNKSTYWTPVVDQAITDLPFNEALNKAVDLLSHTFKKSLHREDKVWADLTGGFDSRLVTMFLAKTGIPFVANCVGPAANQDVEISKLISQAMNWEYQHISLPDDWEQEQCAWFETALHKGDAHLNVLQLAGVLWGHQHRSTLSKTHVLGLGGENWRGFYWPGELLNIGRTPITTYDYILAKLINSVPISILRNDWTEEIRQALTEYFENVVSKYAEFPNTVKLDSLYLFHRHPTHSGAYLSAAVGMVRSVIPLCFKEPTTFAFSLAYKWKLPNSYHFVRVLMERENPRLANIMTTSGGPAVPMRLTNSYKFWPFWKSTTNRATRKFSKKLIGKSIKLWSEKSNYVAYPLPAWRKGWLNFAIAKGLLNPTDMCSESLYDAAKLQSLVQQVEAEDFKYTEFLGRVITLEMALRTVGTSIS